MSENFIEEMVAVIKSAEKIGSVSGKVLLRWKCNKNLIDTTGHCVTNTGAARNRGKGEADQGQYDHKTNQRIFGVCAAASLYRREMLDDIAINNEFFDEDFDTGLEDVDLDWRANLRGWKSFYAPRAVVFHEQGGVISYQAKRARLLHAKNSLLILIKNETLINLLLDLPSFLFIAIPETIKNLSVDPFLFESYIQVFKLLPKTLKKRHFIMKNKKISSLTFRRLFENSPENISIFIFNLTTLIIVIVLFFCLGGLNLLFLFLSLIIISAIIRNLLLLFERIKHEHLNSI
ncbi:MAG: hypothetical protein NT099_04615 [Candidatus Saganbacteria bacterium]|nr:hypothetical protein [Candidatus Saganbacteria bacterium]